MSTTANIPDLTSEDIDAIFEVMDAYLNPTILNAFLDGIYTGIVAIALWNIFSLKPFQAGRRKIILVITIMCLYILEVMAFSTQWWFVHDAFVKNGWNFWEVFLAFQNTGTSFLRILLVTEVSGSISSTIADVIMIWRCWTVWNQQWLIVLLPIVCTLIAIASRVMYIYHYFMDASNIAAPTTYDAFHPWMILYISFILSTTILCTILIIYRIIKVTSHTGRGCAGIQSYKGAIEILAESALLYSLALLLEAIFLFHDSSAWDYIDIVAGVVRGIAPTLVVARVAAGQARPDDSWSESVASSLRFGGHSGDDGSHSGMHSEGSTEEQYIGGSSHDDNHENVDEERSNSEPSGDGDTYGVEFMPPVI
ncbi:hypothetical protein DFS33DRAFT_1388789 [Desarmillaria ectypa]|nr:hypothetical protein DFS33DRAFT_1388789 [Desarmillaria ectypa]